MEILDCTLRDGAHAVGGSFSPSTTEAIVRALCDCGIRVIEFGKPSGIGSNGVYDDMDYLEAVSPHIKSAELGMFCRPDFAKEKDVQLAADYGLGFLRVGTNAGKVEQSEEIISLACKLDIRVRYSLMKAHSVDPGIIAEQAQKLEDFGADSITIMDSTGTMLPEEVAEYVRSVVSKVSIPVGFHGHNNLGLAVCNAMSALKNGALSIDGSIAGLARSAGNAPTEILAALMHKKNVHTEIDLFKLLHFIEGRLDSLIPGITGISPDDIVLGLYGFHSKFLDPAKRISKLYGVDLFELIKETSKINQVDPDESLFQKVAVEIEKKQWENDELIKKGGKTNVE